MLFLFLLSDSGDDSSEKEERESPAEEEETEEENMMPNTAREKEKNKRNELQVLCRKPSQLFSLLFPPPQHLVRQYQNCKKNSVSSQPSKEIFNGIFHENIIFLGKRVFLVGSQEVHAGRVRTDPVMKRGGEGVGENKGGVRREIRSQPNSLSREISEEKEEKKKWGGGRQQRGETSRGVFLPSKSDKKVWSGREIGAKM